ncbi:unnamed protein product [Sphagnum troendelagicum]
MKIRSSESKRCTDFSLPDRKEKQQKPKRRQKDAGGKNHRTCFAPYHPATRVAVCRAAYNISPIAGFPLHPPVARFRYRAIKPKFRVPRSSQRLPPIAHSAGGIS